MEMFPSPYLRTVTQLPVIGNNRKFYDPKAWNSGQIPNDWKHGLIIKLPKKGDLSAIIGRE
jgi:hypothetical protein